MPEQKEEDRVRMVIQVDPVLAEKFRRIMFKKKRSAYYLSREIEIGMMYYCLNEGIAPSTDKIKAVLREVMA